MKISIEVDIEQGMLFKYYNGIYMVCCVNSNEYALISLKNGNRLDDATTLDKLALSIYNNENIKFYARANEYKVRVEM